MTAAAVAPAAVRVVSRAEVHAVTVAVVLDDAPDVYGYLPFSLRPVLFRPTSATVRYSKTDDGWSVAVDLRGEHQPYRGHHVPPTASFRTDAGQPRPDSWPSWLVDRVLIPHQPAAFIAPSGHAHGDYCGAAVYSADGDIDGQCALEYGHGAHRGVGCAL